MLFKSITLDSFIPNPKKTTQKRYMTQGDIEEQIELKADEDSVMDSMRFMKVKKEINLRILML